MNKSHIKNSIYGLIIITLLNIKNNVFAEDDESFLDKFNKLFYDWSSSEISVCKDNSCSLDKWISDAWAQLDWVVTNKNLTEYVTWVITYILWFVTLIWVILVIWAWFQILTWAWDDKKTESAKKIIKWVIIWIIVMWLAYSIVTFVFTILWAKPA